MGEENKGGENGGENEDKKEGGDQAPQGEKVEAIKNPDGTYSIGEKKFIDKGSYDVVAEKQRQATIDKEKRDAEKSEADKKALEEKGQWKELAEKREQEAKDAKSKFQNQLKVNALQSVAGKEAIDIDSIVKLSNLDEIEISEDGKVNQETVTTVVTNLKETKPFLFGEVKKPDVGNGAGGAPDNAGKDMHKASDLAKEDYRNSLPTGELEKIQSENRIIDDYNVA